MTPAGASRASSSADADAPQEDRGGTVKGSGKGDTRRSGDGITDAGTAGAVAAEPVDADAVAPTPDDIGEVLLALGGRLTRLQTELLAGLGQPLTIRQYRILSRVNNGHTSLTALCKLAHRNPSTVSQSVDKLVQQGLLTRGVSHTSRRTMRLALTDTGLAALEAGDQALGKFTAELTARLPEETRDLIRPALYQLYAEIQGHLDSR
ncbi:MarR family winged helix-turn-helix transcriptional regulator [Streptomyces odontomachi]|uniref:MarR family winged helix-turn-helix transcriptional regulator n=1 Tax=Streptomyces odontomachi TaxID=2944940 RepID=UPI00210CB3C6|nr:MarR family transcriptional regulator [Streptomyces sp. ODS25]